MVTFIGLCGDNSEESIYVEIGSLLEEREVPYCTNMMQELNGLFREESYENEWNFATNVVTEAMTLYSKFQYAIRPIIYDLDGGENNPLNPTEGQYGNNVTLYPPLPRIGYIFDGWYGTYIRKTQTDGLYHIQLYIDIMFAYPINVSAKWIDIEQTV